MKFLKKSTYDYRSAAKSCAFALMILFAAGNSRAEEGSANFSRSEGNYIVPSMDMIRHDGVKTRFPAELDDGRPVIMSFIFTTCAAICPMITGLLSGVQVKLGDEMQQVHMVSISIDPEYDRPERLQEYAKKFNAKPQWQFYSGAVKDVEALQKAFSVYRGDKMNHSATILLRGAPGKPWVRLDGFPSSDDVIREYRRSKG